MAENYLPILFQFILAAVVAGAFVGLSLILGPVKKAKDKYDTYECGIDYKKDARRTMNVKFYLIAILFVIFDLEIVFLFPWAVVYKKIGILGIIEMFSFLVVLLVGLIYAWKKGALEWE